MIHLTLKNVIDGAGTALSDGVLGAQQSDGPSKWCQYDYGDGFVCAIGAAFTPTERSRLVEIGHNTSSLGALVENGIVAFPSVTEQRVACAIQVYHDRWTTNEPVAYIRKDVETEFPPLASAVKGRASGTGFQALLDAARAFVPAEQVAA